MTLIRIAKIPNLRRCDQHQSNLGIPAIYSSELSFRRQRLGLQTITTPECEMNKHIVTNWLGEGNTFPNNSRYSKNCIGRPKIDGRRKAALFNRIESLRFQSSEFPERQTWLICDAIGRLSHQQHLKSALQAALPEWQGVDLQWAGQQLLDTGYLRCCGATIAAHQGEVQS